MANNPRFSLSKPYEFSGEQLSASNIWELDEMLLQLYEADRLMLKLLEDGGVVDVDEETGTAEATTGGASTNPWTLVTKTTDETRSNTNANDADLQFAVTAGRRYLVRGNLYFDNGALANAPRYTPTGPAVTTLSYGRAFLGTGGWNSVVSNDDAFPSELTVTTPASAKSMVWIQFLYEPSASGTFIIQWRSSSSTAGNEVTLQKGSNLEYTVIS